MSKLRPNNHRFKPDQRRGPRRPPAALRFKRAMKVAKNAPLRGPRR